MIVYAGILRIQWRMVTVASGFDLPSCLDAVAHIEADLNRLLFTLTEAQFHAPPRTGGWSVAYCIEHLVLAGQAFLSRWNIALKEASPSGFRDHDHFRYSAWHRWILRLAEPPYRLKTKATQPFLPYSRRPMEEAVRRFLSIHQEFIRTMESSRTVDVKHIKVQSPFASWIWYPLGFSFDLALAHERRHIWQAWQVRRQLVDQF